MKLRFSRISTRICLVKKKATNMALREGEADGVELTLNKSFLLTNTMLIVPHDSANMTWVIAESDLLFAYNTQ